MSKEKLEQIKTKKYSYEEVRPLILAALKDRARWLGFFYKVMPKELFDKYGKAAMFEYGKFKKVMGLYPGEDGDVQGFAKFMVSDRVYNLASTNDGDFYPVVYDDKQSVVRFAGNCGLVVGWKEMGLTPEEVKYMCDIACYGDYGFTDELGLKGYFNCTNAEGCEYCEFVVEKKKD